MKTGKRFKLAYIIPALVNPGGMERVLTVKANYFAEHFHYDIHIILTDGKGMDPYYVLDEKIKIHHLDINFEGNYALPLHKRIFLYLKKQRLFKKRLEKKLKEVKPDITISLLRRDINFINDLKDGSIKIGEIHFNRLFYRNFTNNSLPTFIQKIGKHFWNRQFINALKKLKAFVVLTHEDADHWTELSNVKIIHNPLSFYPATYSNLNNKQVIAVGRYVPEKRFDMLIDAWKLVVDKHPNWILKIYGDGMRNELQTKINKLSLQNNCILEHTVSNIVDKYCESSIFMLSSRYEGFPMVLGEAMASGLPAVAFACPCGPRDIIQDGEDSFLVENGNMEQLAERTCRLIENKELRIIMGTKARKNIKRLKVDIIALQWKELFEELTT